VPKVVALPAFQSVTAVTLIALPRVGILPLVILSTPCVTSKSAAEPAFVTLGILTAVVVRVGAVPALVTFGIVTAVIVKVGNVF